MVGMPSWWATKSNTPMPVHNEAWPVSSFMWVVLLTVILNKASYRIVGISAFSPPISLVILLAVRAPSCYLVVVLALVIALVAIINVIWRYNLAAFCAFKLLHIGLFFLTNEWMRKRDGIPILSNLNP